MRAQRNVLQNETEQQPDAWAHNSTEEEIVLSDTRGLIRKVISRPSTSPTTGYRPRIFSRYEPARNRR